MKRQLTSLALLAAAWLSSLAQVREDGVNSARREDYVQKWIHGAMTESH